MEDSSSQEIQASTASSLAGSESEISQGQQGFCGGIWPRQPDLGSILLRVYRTDRQSSLLSDLLYRTLYRLKLRQRCLSAVCKA